VSSLRQAYATILPLVSQPARYTGGERGTVVKDPAQVCLRFALAFPEVYEIAQSHLGLQILYDLLNGRDEIQAERAYAPWIDMEALLRQHGFPLASLDTCTPLSEFDIIGFSLQYELTYTNILMMLDLGVIPLLSREREARHPLIIAGGPCAFHPEPIADFIDAFLLGDGEEAIFDICDVYLAWDKKDRQTLLRALSRIRRALGRRRRRGGRMPTRGPAARSSGDPTSSSTWRFNCQRRSLLRYTERASSTNCGPKSPSCSQRRRASSSIGLGR